MLGHQSPKETLETYADLFDTNLDALADVLDQARAAALKYSPTFNDARRTINDGNANGGENVLSTLAEAG